MSGLVTYLPTARGPISTRMIEIWSEGGRAHNLVDVCAQIDNNRTPSSVLGDEDLQLALYLAYELHSDSDVPPSSKRRVNAGDRHELALPASGSPRQQFRGLPPRKVPRNCCLDGNLDTQGSDAPSG